jgi:DNA-binding NarL/FixJ family response regulator
LALYTIYRGDIDLVITDMMMPVMEGQALIEALYRIDPDVKIIGTSGLHSNADLIKAGRAGVDHFLPKPYAADRLLTAIRTVLSPEPDPLALARRSARATEAGKRPLPILAPS